MPLISQHTQERSKGYFRLEWSLAVDQTKMLAEGVPFLAPAAIDDTREVGAVVPAEFLRVQWMRLPGALPMPQFVAQVKRLLDAPRAATMEPGRPRSGQRGEGAASLDGTRVDRALRARFGWIVGGAVAVVALGVFGWMRQNRSSGPTPPLEAAARRSAPSTSEKAAPLSEARRLVAKARALYEPWDFATREDFALAEQLLRKAVDLDPTDGEAWAAYAILSCGAIVMSIDDSDARRGAVRTQAERAIRLAPDSNHARFANAFSLRFNRQTQDEAIRLLRDEAARQPSNRFVVRTLGAALRNIGQLEQGLVYLDKAAALPGNDPITQYNRALTLNRMNRFVEAEAALDEALAVAPNYIHANRNKLALLLDFREDLPRAKAHLAKVPPAFFLDEQGAVTAYQIALYSKDATKCVEVLRHTKAYLSTVPYNGPKAFLTATAHRLAGNEEAAQTDFRAALRLVNERLAAEPNASRLLLNRAQILASLGEHATVELLLREISQRISTGDEYLHDDDLALLLMLSNRQEEALAALESHYGKPFPIYRSRMGLRYHPVWDPLRGDPRFEALLKVPSQKK